MQKIFGIDQEGLYIKILFQFLNSACLLIYISVYLLVKYLNIEIYIQMQSKFLGISRILSSVELAKF